MPKIVIYENLEDSTFITETKKYIFFFSSEFYLNKFNDEVLEFRKKIKNKFNALYLMPVELDDYADFVYYNKIEKRGFRVVSKDSMEVYEWLGSITLDGVIRTKGS